MEEDSMALEKPEIVEEKSEGHAALLRSKKALRAFHEKCMDFSRENNVTYLSQDNLTELLGGSSNVKTSFVTELINVMCSYNWKPVDSRICFTFLIEVMAGDFINPSRKTRVSSKRPKHWKWLTLS
jgi:hypothetical protein